MQSVRVQVVDLPQHAPNYARDEIDVRSATITDVVIVRHGTVSGKPTCDFQFVAQDGSRFVAMLTGELVGGIAAAVKGVIGDPKT